MTATSTVYDAVTVSHLPADGDGYLAYKNGHYANVGPVEARFPHKPVKTVDVLGDPTADIIDIEPGCVWPPSKGATVASAAVKAGRRPTCYMSASNWMTVRAAVANVGIAGKVDYFPADYDGKPVIPAGAVGKQYLGSPGNSPGPYDKSVVLTSWLTGKKAARKAAGFALPVRAALHVVIGREKRVSPLTPSARALTERALAVLQGWLKLK